jgi:phosphoglycerate dehydrogenase-like enzyme
MKEFKIAYEGLNTAHLAILNKRLAGNNLAWIEVNSITRPLLSSIDALIVKDISFSPDKLPVDGDLGLVIQLDPGEAVIDGTAITRAGIRYERIKWPAWLGVAEHTFLLMLALAKKLVASVERTRASIYAKTLQPKVTTQTEYAFNWTGESGLRVLYRSTLGIIGLGWIGREVARLAAGLEMRVLYHDIRRLPDDDERLLGVTHVSLEELLRSSDFVTLHTRLTPDTERIIDRNALEKMKRTAFLINTARGRLIDEEALIDALEKRAIAGAGLDVFWKEPPEEDNPLLSMENVIATPHHAGIYVGDAAVMVGNYIADALECCILDVARRRQL